MSETLTRANRELRVRKYDLSGLLAKTLEKPRDELRPPYLNKIVMGERSPFSQVKELQNVIMMEISDMQCVGSESNRKIRYYSNKCQIEK